MKKREANFELLRIFAMCMIIGLHYLDKGGVLGSFTEKSGIQGLLPWIFEAFFFPAVNVYVLISGYFLAEKEIKPKKLLSLWGQVLFYSLALGILAYITGIAAWKDVDIYRGAAYVFPVITEHYWFVTAYILLYILLPFFNPVLQRMERKQMRNSLLLLLGILSLSKSVLPLSLAVDRKGYDVLWFLCLYITGAYCRRFAVLKRLEKGRGLLLYVLSCGGMFFSACIIKEIFVRTGHLEDIITYAYSYNHILCYLAAVGLFGCFSSLRIASEKAGNRIGILGGATFGVYLVHEHMDFRYRWCEWLQVGKQAASPWFVLLMFGSIVLVFAVCGAIELIRQKLFTQAGLAISKRDKYGKKEA